MRSIVDGIGRFRGEVFPGQRATYERLARDGQSPKALVVACADSRVAPEHIMQAGPGEIFVCRNAGNIVPPYGLPAGGVTSAVEYAVSALKVRDIVVCGHSDCGAMKGLCSPGALDGMPSVAAWLRHAQAAERIVCEAYPADLSDAERVRALSLENVVAQISNLRTHPSVAAALAAGRLALHGWFFEIGTGAILAYDSAAGRFAPLDPAPPADVPAAA